MSFSLKRRQGQERPQSDETHENRNGEGPTHSSWEKNITGEAKRQTKITSSSLILFSISAATSSTTASAAWNINLIIICVYVSTLWLESYLATMASPIALYIVYNVCTNCKCSMQSSQYWTNPCFPCSRYWSSVQNSFHGDTCNRSSSSILAASRSALIFNLDITDQTSSTRLLI